MIKESKLLVVDKIEDIFRGTGKTTALKELQSEGYFVLGRNFDNLESLKNKVKTFSKGINTDSIKVLIDEDFKPYRGMSINVNGNLTRIEVIGGFATKERIDMDIRSMLYRGTEIIKLKEYIDGKIYDAIMEIECFKNTFFNFINSCGK